MERTWIEDLDTVIGKTIIEAHSTESNMVLVFSDGTSLLVSSGGTILLSNVPGGIPINERYELGIITELEAARLLKDSKDGHYENKLHNQH